METEGIEFEEDQDEDLDITVQDPAERARDEFLMRENEMTTEQLMEEIRTKAPRGQEVFDLFQKLQVWLNLHVPEHNQVSMAQFTNFYAGDIYAALLDK